jgi:hypothetical protein
MVARRVSQELATIVDVLAEALGLGQINKPENGEFASNYLQLQRVPCLIRENWF